MSKVVIEFDTNDSKPVLKVDGMPIEFANCSVDYYNPQTGHPEFTFYFEQTTTNTQGLRETRRYVMKPPISDASKAFVVETVLDKDKAMVDTIDYLEQRHRRGNE